MRLSIDLSTISKILKKLDFRYKKTRRASERDNEKNKPLRDVYTQEQPKLAAGFFVP
jgi:transposase